MKKPFFEGRKVLVVGLQRSGIAVSKLLLKYGCSILGTDLKKREDLSPELSTLEEDGVKLACGEKDFHVPRDIDFIVASPGVPLSSPVLSEAKKLGREVVGELEVAFTVLKSRSVCVTGTNGKSTCVNLIGEILSRAGHRTVVSGNVGFALSNIALSLVENDVAVVEVSSFQLETIRSMRPDVGVLLNVTPDHLDRHGTFEEYLRLKMRLFENQRKEDCAVINRDDRVEERAFASVRSRILSFGMEKSRGEGAFVEDGRLKVDLGGETRTIIPVEKISIKGPHNLMNAMASVCAALLFGVTEDSIALSLEEFKGLPHRLENLGSFHGVTFINDSKATNIDALEKALLSFSAPLILIAGGRDKDGNFFGLRELVKKSVKHVVLIGEAAQKIKESWRDTPSSEAKSMGEAVGAAFGLAGPGGIVLLSPGCASYDMFRDFEDRGTKFREAFLSLKERRTVGNKA